MTIEYIVEICVGIDIAILGIAYPLIVDKVSNIGDKYSSIYLSELFNMEFPQRNFSIKILKKKRKISILQFTLYLTIITFIFLIFQFKPILGWNNWFINNSAKLLVFSSTFFLTTFFFIWLDKVVLYNGKSNNLLKRIIGKYKATKNLNIKPYYLKTINEITYYAIDKQDEHLQEQLVEFYYNEFTTIRREHKTTEPLIYPIDLYFMVHKLCLQLADSENKKLPVIEHRAVSGTWLLGQGFEEIPISDDTYSWLWRNLYVISDNKKFIKKYWATAYQYFDYQLRIIDDDYDFGTGEVKNKEAVLNRNKERKKFLEFNYALGGLLLYRNQYDALKYIFQYSQSIPPKFVLLPETMTEIFEWFEEFRNEFKSHSTPVDMKFFFPELDNLGNQGQVVFWICSYITLLFIRQYTLHQYYTFQDFTALPRLPDDVIELNNWLDSISYFEICLNEILQNPELIKSVGFEKIVEKKKSNFKEFIDILKEKIIEKIGEQKYNAPLSEVKVQSFKNKSNEIITQSFALYDTIFTSINEEEKDNELKLNINGVKTLMSKSAFTEGDIPVFYYDSILAEQISNGKIKDLIPNSFSIARTRRYLFNKDNIIEALEKIIEKNINAVIVAINTDVDLESILKKYDIVIRSIPTTRFRFRNVLFVLNNYDLPSMEHIDLDEKEIKNEKLDLINDNIKLYASVVDINQPENVKIKENWNSEELKDNMDLKVQATIAFITNIYWKKDRDIIQINIANPYEEQGLQNELNDIKPLKNRKN